MIEALSKPAIIKFTPGAQYTLEHLKADLFGEAIARACEKKLEEVITNENQ